MTTTRPLGPAALIAALALAGAASAQPPAPGGAVSPPYSPYLNLLRGGGSPAMNYFGLVRPQQNINQAVASIQSNVSANASAIGTLAATGGLPPTGYAARFQTHGGYFLNQGGGGAGSGGAGAGVAGIGGRVGAPVYSPYGNVARSAPQAANGVRPLVGPGSFR